MTRIRQTHTMTGLYLVPRQWRIVAALGTAVSAWLLSVGATPAPAQGLLDANCPGPPRTGGGIVSSGDDREAQSFTAQRTGDLVRGELEIGKPAATMGDWVMQVLSTDDSGTPVNTVLATTLIADGTVPAGDSRLVGLFAPPASVGAGQHYALLLTRPGASSWAAQTRGGNACPGTYFLSSSQAGPWSAGSNPMDDIVFAVFVEPPPGGPGAAPPSGPGTAPSTCDGVAATIVGTEGSDQLPGTAGTDVISALGGNDTVSALAANDIVCGGAGKDTLKGGKGKDTMLGQEGRDNLKGGGAKDICKGGKGKDTASKCEVEKSI